MDERLENRKCQFCGIPFTGRSDKKFCSHYCRSAYHNNRNYEVNKVFREIMSKLLKNRSILKRLNPAEKSIVTKKQLEESGFCFSYFTHYIKTDDSKIIMFCFDYGYQYMKMEKKYYLVRQEHIVKTPPK